MCELYGRPIFMFLSLHAVFLNGCVRLHSHQQSIWNSFLHILTRICYFILFFWMTANLTKVKISFLFFFLFPWYPCYWACLHGPIWKVPVYVLGPLLSWNASISGFLSPFTYFGYWAFLSCVVFQYFLPFCLLALYFVYGSLAA